tara:strand:+ start:4290 stop:6170 length:1881 start_codon:yes stop_codon:yes gene_type:complete
MATRKEVKEAIIDNIIDVMITNVDTLDFDLSQHRKTIDDSGQISTGTNPNKKKIVLYEQDHQEIDSTLSDVVNTITDCWETSAGSGVYDTPPTHTLFSFNVGAYDATYNPDTIPSVQMDYATAICTTSETHIYLTDGVKNYLSQLITFETTTTDIDIDKAKEILDTDIFELIPRRTTRQSRIDKFFKEFEELKGTIPDFNFDVDGDGTPDTWKRGVTGKQNDHNTQNDISSTNPDGNIVRLDTHAPGGNINEDQTLESLRNRLNDYLTDIDKDVDQDPLDGRPEYENKSDGYLKIRGLNQAIVIRNESGDDVGLIGDDSTDPKWLNDGFTITMWVKFLNKVNGGTLFNFGNPFRQYNPKGFALETYSLFKDGLVNSQSSDGDFLNLTWGDYIYNNTEGNGGNDYFHPEHTFFKDSDYERFIRLVVREEPTATHERGPLLDSHVGLSRAREGYLQSRLTTFNDANYEWGGTIPTAPDWVSGDATYEGSTGAGHWQPQKLLTHTRVPLDLNGWYYIVANYNPGILEIPRNGSCTDDGDATTADDGKECGPNGLTSLKYHSDYWRWNVNYGYEGEDGIAPTDTIIVDNPMLDGTDKIGAYTANSGFGAKCKVEIISRKDLLRARGFKPS